MALSKGRFLKFAVTWVESDLARMTTFLAENPEHRDELLNGSRVGRGGGTYSAVGYACWLCQFDDYAESARQTLRWLLEQGAEPSVWTAIALRDEHAFRQWLEADPDLAAAREPVWQTPMLQIVPEGWRSILIAHGLDLSDIWSCIFLGDEQAVRDHIARDPGLLDPSRRQVQGTVLDRTICAGLDDLACWLLDQGAPNVADPQGLTPLALCCIWACPKTAEALIARGADVADKRIDRSLLSFAMTPVRPSVEVVDVLVRSGGLAHEPNPQALIAAAEAKGHPELGGRLRQLLV